MDYFTPEEIHEEHPEIKPLILYGGPLFDGKNTVYEDGALFIRDGIVELAGSEESVFTELDRTADMDVIDTQGRVIFPGMINLHHHFMAPLLLGLSPAAPVTSFREKLQHLDWRLEKVIDQDAVQIAALQSLMESVRYGVTMVFDHHSSPNNTENSLNAIAAAVEKTGIRAVICHEVSDRNGKDVFHKQLEENLGFINDTGENKNVHGVLGLHANFTLSENSLREIADRYDAGRGIHVHCGEDPSDKNYCRELGYKGCADRLDKFGLLNEKALLAHGLHLTRSDITIIEKTGAIIIHNPESNANNQVGQMVIPPTRGLTIGLGTDGMSSSMLQTLRSAYLLQRHTGSDEEILERHLQEFLFANNRAAAARFFGGNPGLLTPGNRADVVVFDYIPTTPFHSNNFMKHLLFGMYCRQADTVIAAGKIIYRDKAFLTIDEQLILDEGREASRRIWTNYVKHAE